MIINVYLILMYEWIKRYQTKTLFVNSYILNLTMKELSSGVYIYVKYCIGGGEGGGGW